VRRALLPEGLHAIAVPRPTESTKLLDADCAGKHPDPD